MNFLKTLKNNLESQMLSPVLPWSDRYWNVSCRKLGLPFVYVRPEAKTRRLNQVEGFFAKGQNVIVEDLISTGNSSLLLKPYVQLAQT
jgi:hypothetical protein